MNNNDKIACKYYSPKIEEGHKVNKWLVYDVHACTKGKVNLDGTIIETRECTCYEDFSRCTIKDLEAWEPPEG